MIWVNWEAKNFKIPSIKLVASVQIAENHFFRFYINQNDSDLPNYVNEKNIELLQQLTVSINSFSIIEEWKGIWN